MARVLLKVFSFQLVFGVVLATWGAYLATPGSWFDAWWLRQYGGYGDGYACVATIIVLCLAFTLFLAGVVAAMRGALRGGPRVKLFPFDVPMKVGWPTSRYRRRRVRGVP